MHVDNIPKASIFNSIALQKINKKDSNWILIIFCILMKFESEKISLFINKSTYESSTKAYCSILRMLIKNFFLNKFYVHLSKFYWFLL